MKSSHILVGRLVNIYIYIYINIHIYIYTYIQDLVVGFYGLDKSKVISGWALRLSS